MAHADRFSLRRRETGPVMPSEALKQTLHQSAFAEVRGFAQRIEFPESAARAIPLRIL